VFQALTKFDKRAEALEGRGGRGRFDPRRSSGQVTLTGIGRSLGMLMRLLQGADATPTSQVVTAVTDGQKDLERVIAEWNKLKTQDRMNLNTKLKEVNLPVIKVAAYLQHE